MKNEIKKYKNFYLLLIGIFFLLIIGKPVKTFAVDWWSNEMSNFHRTISINLNGGSSSFMTWSYSIDRGDAAGEMRVGQIPSGSFLSRECENWPNATPNFNDNDWPREGTFHEHMDCVGVTPYVTIVTPSRAGYRFVGWDTNDECYEENGLWYFETGCWGNDHELIINAVWEASVSHQIVNVRYQNADGTWGNYSAVINQDYQIGSTLSWSRPEDAVYNSASIGYVVGGDGTHYIDVSRKKYNQQIYVRYQQENGGWSSYQRVVNNAYYYGARVSWSRAADATYAAASIQFTASNSNTVRYVDVYRRQYNQVVYVRYQQNDGSWGSYSAVINKMYYFGATVGWSRAEDDCYYGASVSFSANGANVRYVDVARKQYQFSIGGQYNGDRTSSFADYATADVYINGVLVADNCTSYSQNVYYGAKYEITDIKTVTGYTFDGIVGTYNATSGTISKGGTIYLAFHLNKYTIHFECVGGIDGPPDVTLSYGQEYTLNIVPIRSGYTLTSWNTKEDGTGRAYAVDATLKNLTEADNVTVVLYAQWTQRRLSLVKVGSTSYGASFVRRSAGDEAWYDRMGSLKIDEPVPDEIVIQQWVIEKDGNITRVK